MGYFRPESIYHGNVRIDHYRFGTLRIDGVAYSKDMIIVGGVVHSPWRRTAGSHVFAPVDLVNIIEAAPDIVCLGTGAVGMVTVEDETIAAFEKIGTEVVIDRTGRVVEAFNRFSAEGRNVAAALHLMC
jgi:hypothetical protein